MAQNCGIRCAGNAELGEAEEAEDHDRVKDDVDDRASGLADHAQLGAAGGLQESLEVHLEEETKRHACDDGEVCVAVFDDFGGCGGIRAGFELHGERPVGAKDREQQERDKAAEGQEDAHIGGCVGPVEALLAEGTGEQRVHTDTGTGTNCDHEVLQGESIGDRGERVLTKSCYENTVYDIVEGLHQHGNHHGKRHTDDELFDGHDAHFVFSGSVGCQV